MHLYFKLIAIPLRSQMQHRASFFLLTFSYFASCFTEIIGIWVLFDRFKMVQGWTLSELAIVYGIVHMGFSLAESAGRGFDNFGDQLKSGDFDRLLLRPCSTLVQVAALDFQLLRLGRFVQALLVLLWGCAELHLWLLSISGLVILLSIMGTMCLFYGLLILQATLAFWTTETLEIMNITTFGGVEAGQYPMSIYPRAFRLFFTIVIPLACVAYYPAAIMLQKEIFSLWLAFVAPGAGVLFLLAMCFLWKIGVRRYHSSGS